MGFSAFFRIHLLMPLFKARTLPFWLFFVLTSCQTETEIVVPDAPPKLVISSFISPEAPQIEVSVTKSASLLSPENTGKANIVTDATVWLSDRQDSVQLAFDLVSLYTASNYPIKPGKTYFLRVTAPGGFTASASCTVPVKINQSLTARIDSSEINAQNPDSLYRLVLRWQDLPGEGDYYRVQAVAATGEAGSPVITSRQTITFLEEPQVRDLNADGRTWQISSDAFFDFAKQRQTGTLKYYDVYLLTADRAYYEFHKSHFQYQLSNSYTDPIKLYSNVKGGLGIFGTYRMYTFQVPVK